MPVYDVGALLLGLRYEGSLQKYKCKIFCLFIGWYSMTIHCFFNNFFTHLHFT